MEIFSGIHILNQNKIILLNDNMQKDEETTKKETYYTFGETFRNNWYKFNDVWYYFKGLHKTEFIVNEILGSIIAEYLELPTVKYTLAKKEMNHLPIYGIISPNFKQHDKYYLDGTVFKHKINKNYKNLKMLKNICFDKENYEKLIQEFLKKCALDIFISQIDSVGYNCYFEQFNKNTKLSPLFDYAISFNTTFNNKYYDFENIFYSYTYSIPNNLTNKHLEYIYGNFLFMLQLPSKDFNYLICKYPEFKEAIYKLLYFDIKKSLNKIEENYTIDIPKSLKEHYINEVNCKQKLFRYSL